MSFPWRWQEEFCGESESKKWETCWYWGFEVLGFLVFQEENCDDLLISKNGKFHPIIEFFVSDTTKHMVYI